MGPGGEEVVPLRKSSSSLHQLMDTAYHKSPSAFGFTLQSRATFFCSSTLAIVLPFRSVPASFLLLFQQHTKQCSSESFLWLFFFVSFSSFLFVFFVFGGLSVTFCAFFQSAATKQVQQQRALRRGGCLAVSKGCQNKSRYRRQGRSSSPLTLATTVTLRQTQKPPTRMGLPLHLWRP